MNCFQEIQKFSVLDWLEKHGYPHELVHANAAFDGDVEAAQKLSFALKNNRRGYVAVALWQCKVPVAAFRAFFSNVWDHDHRIVIASAGTHRRLGAMFHYAAFPIPKNLPELVTVWRGTSNLTLAQAKLGYSWTVDKDVAAWFAMRNTDRNIHPLVLKAVVAKRDIALYHTERLESEVVLLRPPFSLIDGNLKEWFEGFERQQAIVERHNN